MCVVSTLHGIPLVVNPRQEVAPESPRLQLRPRQLRVHLSETPNLVKGLKGGSQYVSPSMKLFFGNNGKQEKDVVEE